MAQSHGVERHRGAEHRGACMVVHTSKMRHCSGNGRPLLR